MQIMCATCRRALVTFEPPSGGSFWTHAPGQPEDGDHAPAPVLSYPDYRCDACNDEPVTAVLHVTGRFPLSAQISTADPWALCATCAALITANDWDGLLSHVIGRLRASGLRLTSGEEDFLRRLQVDLRTRAVGPPTPLPENTEPPVPWAGY